MLWAATNHKSHSEQWRRNKIAALRIYEKNTFFKLQYEAANKHDKLKIFVVINRHSRAHEAGFFLLSQLNTYYATGTDTAKERRTLSAGKKISNHSSLKISSSCTLHYPTMCDQMDDWRNENRVTVENILCEGKAQNVYIYLKYGQNCRRSLVRLIWNLPE